MEEEKISGLDELRKEYSILAKKYDLPGFSELNKTFDIEEIDSDTEFLLRRVRRVVSGRIEIYLRFIEIILNPANAPMFFFKLIKKLEEDDKKQLTVIYEDFGKLELNAIKLDLKYDEEKEAEFVKNVYKIFNEKISGELLMAVKKMGNGEGNVKKESKGSYFG
jgi:hypothetical protein